MCIIIPEQVRLRIILLIGLFVFVPSVYTRCGCHKMPGQGFLGHKPGGPEHKFEPLPHSIHSAGNGGGGGAKYSVPNFRVLLFQPTFLDFQEQPVGMPYVQSIVLSNPSDQNDIEITAINALPPFHSSRFSKKVLAPMTNMSIDIVFLSTMVGNVEHTVYIYTSKGNFPYQVFGVGTHNPYRLRAFVSARIPLNGTFSPYINMYNPHSEAIQITEMYSSGSDLHLDLLGNNNDSIGKLWEIPPYETKAIMKATYHSKEEGLNVRFIRIVVGPPVPDTQTLILPFEILVSTKPGLYTNVDMLDFGTLRTMDEPKSLNLNALNLGNKSLQLLSIQVIPPNKAVNIHFTPVSLKPSKKYSKIATVTYTAQQVSNKRQSSGKIIVYTADEKKKLEIPYQANVLHGTLAYSVGKTSFYVGNSPKTQVLTITNTFNTTLVIYNATLPVEAQEIFSISNFSNPVVVPSGQLLSPLSLNFKANESQLSLSTVLRLYTNASIFTIPVHCYNGMLKYEVESLNDDLLDYGTVGVLENRTLIFRIINNNPVEVSIKEIGTDFEYARLQLMHVKNLKKSKPKRNSRSLHNNTSTSVPSSSKTKSKTKKENEAELILKPSDVVTFSVDIQAPVVEGTYNGEILMKTIYQEIHIPIYLKTVEGSLTSKPKRIKIEKAFPGRTETYPIAIESSFGYPIQLENLTIYPEDPRFQMMKPDFLPKLPPKEKVHVGWVKFDPYYGNPSQCFLCICELDPACDHWPNTLNLPEDTWEHDINLIEKLRKKWDVVETKQDASFNASIIVDSSVIKSYTIPVQASLAWPSLVEQSIRFPPTYVGNFSSGDMVITNPSDHSLVVQIIPLLHYPQPQGGLDLLSEGLIMDSFSLDLNGNSQFFLPEVKNGFHDNYDVQAALNVYPSPKSMSMILEPRQKKIVKVGFIPDDESTRTSIMVVRNNLTVLDLVVVHGQGARTNVNINGKPPGTKSSILLFEIKAVHLKDCNKSSPKARLYPSFTVKRSFTATNKGSLPIQIVSLNINNYECEGFGFRILNCEPFVLQPNTSRKIDITFIPDFTTSRISRTLRAVTTMGQSLDFILLATLPHHLLPLCASALPRPFWEPYFHIVAAILMSAVFIFIIIFAYFDAQKYVVQCTFTAGSASYTTKDMDVYTAGTVFDLNAIGLKVRITDNKKEKYTDNTRNSIATSKGSPTSMKACDLSGSDPNLRKRSSSDSSSTTSSRKSSVSQPPVSTLPEEKPEPSKTKDALDTPPKKSKRKLDAKNRQQRLPSYEEPPEPVVEPVIEVIYDPYDREQMGKFRQDRQQKLKHKQEHEDGEKQKRKKKNVSKKESQHRVLQKENSYGSSNADDDDQSDEKPAGFTSVKSKPKKRGELTHANTMDRLDDISLTEPPIRPKESLKKTKSEPRPRQSVRNTPATKKTAFHHEKERMLMETPTSPHAIAAAIFDAALMKKKKKGGKKSQSQNVSSGPTSPSGLSSSSRSDSYTNINDPLHDRTRSATPSGLLHDSPTGSARSSPNQYYEDLSDSSPKKSKKDVNTGWSFFKRLGFPTIGKDDEVEEHSPITSGSSMFYYDNLSSLRASRQNVSEDEGTFKRAPGRQNSSFSKKSILSPDSAEFVPAAQRVSKAVGSNLKKDNSWASVDDSALLRPPPGLTRQRQARTDIWGLEDIATGKRTTESWDDNSTFGYSSLLNGPSGAKTLLGSFDFFGNRTNSSRDEIPSLWGSNDDFEKDVWGTNSIRPSIWDTPDALMPPTSSSSNTPRSRLGLGLDLKPLSEEVGPGSSLNDAESPLDPFNIWANVDSPYEGWNQDIKRD